MSKKTDRYDELWKEIEGISSRPVRLRELASSACEELTSDFAGVDLADSRVAPLLREAIGIKFAQHDLEVEIIQRSVTSELPEGNHLVRATIGKYPEAAYNVDVVLVDGCVRVHFFRVPEEGNPRS